MKTLGYYNGETGELEDMRIPMLDRASYFGDGVYDATYAQGGVILFLDEHLDRFFNSARFLEIPLDTDKAALGALLGSLTRRVKSEGPLFVYWQVSRGTARRGHNYPDRAAANLTVMIYPQALRDNFKPVKLLSVEDTRFLHCNIKTLNLIPNVMAHEKARQAGCEEAVFHRSGRVTECASSNIHILQSGVFRTAPADNLILAGIARAHLIKQCRLLGIPVSEEPFTLDELKSAGEVIISSAGSLCVPVSHIDGTSVGGKEPALLAKLRAAVIAEFEQVMSGRAALA